LRVNYDYKSKEDWEQEKAEFMSLYYYFDDEEWFDKEAVDKYVHNKQNPFYNAKLKRESASRISTTRIPTRCPKYRRAWAIEIGVGNKFSPNFLDPSVYNNIPLIKGLCHECKKEENE
jgi:hypothetical protein